jgi:hypothetical protein
MGISHANHGKSLLYIVVVGNPLPKWAKAVQPHQFGGATKKTVANLYGTFHKSVFFKF